MSLRLGTDVVLGFAKVCFVTPLLFLAASLCAGFLSLGAVALPCRVVRSLESAVFCVFGCGVSGPDLFVAAFSSEAAAWELAVSLNLVCGWLDFRVGPV